MSVLKTEAAWRDLEVVMPSDVSQTEEENTTRFHGYAESKEQKEPTSQKRTHEYSAQFGAGQGTGLGDREDGVRG